MPRWEQQRKNTVAVVRLGKPAYPETAPYNPSEPYPEYPFAGELSGEENAVYRGVRRLFFELGLDREHYETPRWNPLGHLIKPGMKVVINPNFVLSRHKEGKDLFSIITHPAVLRAIADYCWIALKGEGRLIIADAPQYDCNFQELLEETQLPRVAELYARFPGPALELLDLRSYWSRGKHFASQKLPLPGDPEGHITVNLGRKSALYGKGHDDKLYGAVYDRDETIRHHRGETHEYQLSRTILGADVVISVPKLKVHKKVGVTLNAKGLVGTATNKNYLVHYTLTSPREGGDQYPDDLFTPLEKRLMKMERWMYDHFLSSGNRFLEYLHRSIYAFHNTFTKRLGIKVQEEKRWLDAGNWYGNDSAWRMTVDLLRAFYFADLDGRLRDTQQRATFSVIDGVVGGENKGPLVPDPQPSGVLLGGENLVAVDLVATRLMGFDPLKLKMYKTVLEDLDFDFGVRSLDDIEVVCATDRAWQNCLQNQTDRFLDYKPFPGWKGHIEIGVKEELFEDADV